MVRMPTAVAMDMIQRTAAEADAEAVVPAPKNGNLKWPPGWRPYASIVSGFLMMACTWGLIMSYGVFFEHYDNKFMPLATDLQLSLIGGTQSFQTLLFSFVVGRLLDVGQHRPILGVGAVFLIGGFFSLSYIQRGDIFLAWLTSGFSSGLGMTCFFMYSSHNVIGWIPHKAYMANGLSTSGAGFGGIAYPPMFKLIDQLGFATGIRIYAAIIGVLIIVACALGLSKPPQKEAQLGPILKVRTWICLAAFKDPAYRWYTLSMWFVFAAFYPLTYHLAEWAEERRGLGRFPGYWYISIINGNGVGRIVTGYIASRSENPIAIQGITTIIAAVTVVTFWPLASNDAAVIAFCVVLGLLAGAMFGLPASGVAYLIPAEHQGSRGSWTGLMWSSCAPFSLIGPLFGGLLRQKHGLPAVGYWAGANLLVASVFLLLSVVAKNRQLLGFLAKSMPKRN